MDSKQKHVKSRCRKKKYQPKHVAAANLNRATKSAAKDADQSEEQSEDDFGLSQPVPQGGWFPESDSEESSDLDDFTSLANITSKTKQSDKNWFDKELDNVQVAAEVPVDSKDDKDKNQVKPISNSKLSSSILKKVIKDEKSNDNDEEELDFLLSLKEPVYTGPVSTKKDIEKDTKLIPPSTNREEQKPVKSIDLEKWLDSVLDD